MRNPSKKVGPFFLFRNTLGKVVNSVLTYLRKTLDCEGSGIVSSYFFCCSYWKTWNYVLYIFEICINSSETLMPSLFIHVIYRIACWETLYIICEITSCENNTVIKGRTGFLFRPWGNLSFLFYNKLFLSMDRPITDGAVSYKSCWVLLARFDTILLTPVLHDYCLMSKTCSLCVKSNLNRMSNTGPTSLFWKYLLNQNCAVLCINAL